MIRNFKEIIYIFKEFYLFKENYIVIIIYYIKISNILLNKLYIN